MRWAITGGHGMLATDLSDRLAKVGIHAHAVDRDDVDITDLAACEDLMTDIDVVVNCAAWTAVDDAESHEPQAFSVNALGAAHLARAAHVAGVRMVQISTDYVFRGDATEPYPAGAPYAPLSAYGRTKAAGEWAVRATSSSHIIVRTAWLYGQHGPNFASTIAKIARERGQVKVVNDQFGQPTWTVDLADLIVRLVEAKVPGGIYHGTSSGAASWYEFAQSIVSAAGMDPAMVIPVSSEEFIRPAPRPRYSVLAHDTVVQAGLDPIGQWLDRWKIAAPALVH